MHHCLHPLGAAWASALALGLPLLAAAQGRADAADPQAPARVLTHRSAFADYKPFRDIPPGDWRRLNDTVGRAALQPGGAVVTPPTTPPVTPTPGHPPHGQGGSR